MWWTGNLPTISFRTVLLYAIKSHVSLKQKKQSMTLFSNQNTKHYLGLWLVFPTLCSGLSTIPQHYSLNFSLTPLFLSVFLFTDFPLICTYLYLHMFALYTYVCCSLFVSHLFQLTAVSLYCITDVSSACTFSFHISSSLSYNFTSIPLPFAYSTISEKYGKLQAVRHNFIVLVFWTCAR
jgi:hypothetical protein